MFCQRWWSRLPLPLTDADRTGGYWWDIAMRQVEVSRTIVFDRPRQARGFFEALCADNLDIGRPEQMQIVFGRRVRTPPPDGYRTRLLRSGDEVTLNAHFGHSRVKSYLKCGRAFRIETVVNDTADLGVARRLQHLPEIWAKARDVNRRMVDAFRVGQGCVLASPAFERAARPTLEDGRRPSPRFGDPRVMALVGALCAGLHVVAGFTNRSLRARVNSLLGVPMGQMSYDLRRLRMKVVARTDPGDGAASASRPWVTGAACGWPLVRVRRQPDHVLQSATALPFLGRRRPVLVLGGTRGQVGIDVVEVERRLRAGELSCPCGGGRRRGGTPAGGRSAASAICARAAAGVTTAR